jgi:tRNA pseudouridine55 synthase
MAGISLIDKPSGISSFSALSPIKKTVGTCKVGHAGTLDRFASGLLIVLIGPYTKLNPYFSGLDKSYEGRMRFGETTSTLDPEGEICERAPIPDIEKILGVTENYRGTFSQIPPKFSAVHVNGQRAYRRALAGEDVEIAGRSVTVSSFIVRNWKKPNLDFSVSCSKGTYIRSLARDIGIDCGSVAYLTSLRRIEIGPFSVDRAVAPDSFDPAKNIIHRRRLFDSLGDITTRIVQNSYVDKIKNGMKLSFDVLNSILDKKIAGDSQNLALFDASEKLLAVVEAGAGDGEIHYRFVMPKEKSPC